MPISEFTGQEIDSNSEEYRYECELRHLLNSCPTRRDKHLFLYGVEDRADLFFFDSKTGQHEIKDQYDCNKSSRKLPPSVFKFRGLEEADKILADAKRLYELRQKRSADQPAAQAAQQENV